MLHRQEVEQLISFIDQTYDNNFKKYYPEEFLLMSDKASHADFPLPSLILNKEIDSIKPLSKLYPQLAKQDLNNDDLTDANIVLKVYTYALQNDLQYSHVVYKSLEYIALNSTGKRRPNFKIKDNKG